MKQHIKDKECIVYMCFLVWFNITWVSSSPFFTDKAQWFEELEALISLLILTFWSRFP